MITQRAAAHNLPSETALAVGLLRCSPPATRPVATPLDERAAPVEGEREEGYGRIIVRVGDQSKETYSTSRKELVTLLLEAAALPPLEWSSLGA